MIEVNNPQRDMGTEEKINTFLQGLKIQESKWNSHISYLREHKFNKEADYVDVKRKVLREVISEYEMVFNHNARADGYPRFDFEY